MGTPKVKKLKISINNKYVYIDLEEEFLASLKEVAKMEGLTLKELYELVFRTSDGEADLPRAIRVFVCAYYRNLAVVLPRDYANTLISKLRDHK